MTPQRLPLPGGARGGVSLSILIGRCELPALPRCLDESSSVTLLLVWPSVSGDPSCAAVLVRPSASSWTRSCKFWITMRWRAREYCENIPEGQGPVGITLLSRGSRSREIVCRLSCVLEPNG